MDDTDDRLQLRQPFNSISVSIALAFIFLALIFFALPAAAVDVLDIQLYKGVLYSQTGSGAPVLTNDPYIFQAYFGPSYAPFVSGVSVQTPRHSTHPIPLNSQTNFNFTAEDTSQANLDISYGSGTYNMNYTGVDDGATSTPVTLGVDDVPPAPVISNVLAAQSVIASNAFTLTFAPGIASDYVQLVVMDTNLTPIFQTPPIYTSQGLSATNTAITIPARTLLASDSYTATLSYIRLTTLSLGSFPFVQAGFFAQTIFSVQTQGIPTNPPSGGPFAPTSFTGSYLTLTIANGSGSFASNGSYQLFTSPVGTNYTILGTAGQNFSVGTYAYTATGSNSAQLSLTDSILGAGISLQALFTGPGTGTYSITSPGSGAQSGLLIAASNYCTVAPASLYLPAATNRQFQTFFIGQPGGAYSLQTSSNMSVWTDLTNFSLTDLAATIGDSNAAAGRFYRTRIESVTFAPASIIGQTFNFSITGGAAPQTTSGIFQFLTASNGAMYEVLGGPGATNGSGSYSYSTTGPQTATITFNDTTTGVITSARLFFMSSGNGFFYLTRNSAGGFQSGSFTYSPGPILFLGNAKFTPDTNRGSSVNFMGNGTPASLSVTDSLGFTWTLTIPGDALRTPAIISMAPFTAIDSSSSLLPVASGVRFSPDGTQFEDGLLLTVTAPPGILGNHPALAMADGGGSSLYLVPATNQANSFSTTLFHFSSGAMFNPSDAQWQQIQNQFANDPFGVLNGALLDAVNKMLALEDTIVPPVEPPDGGFTCNDMTAPAANYVNSLFSPEMAAIKNLDYVVSAYKYFTGMDLSGQYAMLEEGVIATSAYRKVSDLFKYFKTDALKYNAVCFAANRVNNLDLKYGGFGFDAFFQPHLKEWISGTVVNYYLNKLISKHDYTGASAVAGIKQEFANYQLDPSAVVQKFASALTFQVQVNANVQENGTVPVNVSAAGTFEVMGDSEAQDIDIFPLSGGTNMNYTASTVGRDSLQLPLSYLAKVNIVFDPCGNTMTVFVSRIGISDAPELYSGPDGPSSGFFLSDDTESALYSTFGTANINPDYNSDYAFPVGPFANFQTAFATTIVGQSGATAATIQIQIMHTPQ